MSDQVDVFKDTVKIVRDEVIKISKKSVDDQLFLDQAQSYLKQNKTIDQRLLIKYIPEIENGIM